MINLTQNCLKCSLPCPMGWDRCRSCMAKDGAQWREDNRLNGRLNLITINLWRAKE